MPKTKSQKEKQLERDNRNQAKALKRQAEKEERALAIKKQLELEAQLKKEVTQNKSYKKVIAKEMKDLEKKDESSQTKMGTDGLSDESLAQTQAQTKAIQAAKEDLKLEAKSLVQSKPARIIENHTTYVSELKAKLYKLAPLIPGGSIQAGELTSSSNKAQFFSLEFQRTLERSNIYKFLACSESTKQEVIITVTDAEKYSPQFISNAIDNIEKSNSNAETKKNQKQEDLAYSYYNRTLGKERQTLWKAQHKELSVREKTQEKAEKKALKIAQQGKKLASKVPRDQVKDYAERDVEIIAGTSRTRYSKF